MLRCSHRIVYTGPVVVSVLPLTLALFWPPEDWAVFIGLVLLVAGIVAAVALYEVRKTSIVVDEKWVHVHQTDRFGGRMLRSDVRGLRMTGHELRKPDGYWELRGRHVDQSVFITPVWSQDQIARLRQVLGLADEEPG